MTKHYKKDLIQAVQNDLGLTATKAQQVVDCVLESITQLTKEAGSSLAIRGLGTFTKKVTDARIGRNPQTGEQLTIPSKEVVRFKASKA